MLPARVKEIRLCMSVHGIAVGIECRSSARARFWVGSGKGYWRFDNSVSVERLYGWAQLTDILGKPAPGPGEIQRQALGTCKFDRWA